MARKKKSGFRLFRLIKAKLSFKWILILALSVSFVLLIWLWLQNPAKRAEKPLIGALSYLHPSLICDNGAGRLEPDTSPWYISYYYIDDGGHSTSLDSKVLSVARKYGYKLGVDAKRISSIANGGSDSIVGEKLDENGVNKYYTGSNASDNLSVAIIYAGSEPLDCTNPLSDWMKASTPQSGRAILELELVPK